VAPIFSCVFLNRRDIEYSMKNCLSTKPKEGPRKEAKMEDKLREA
jgi:hypothetical protein